MRATLVTTAKNEGPYILEWVAHHRQLGFTDIVFFQNNSDDYTHQTLRSLHDIGAVHYFYNRATSGRHQVKAYKRASRTEVFKKADWAMALDLDEFLTVHAGQGKIADLVDAVPDSDQIIVNWKLFGNDGHDSLSDELVTERFTKAEPVDMILEHLSPFKSMFKPKSFERPGIHNPRTFKRKTRSAQVTNGSGLKQGRFAVKNWRSTDPGRRAHAQVNHYAVKDTATYVVKNARGSAHQNNRTLDTRYWGLNNFNTETDLSMVRRSGAIQDEMYRLDAQSNGRLMAMRQKALDKHRIRFAKLIKEDANVELFDLCQSITK